MNHVHKQEWLRGAVEPDLESQAVAKLFSLLEQRNVEYVLDGGMALHFYIQTPGPLDLVVLMDLSSLEDLPELAISSQEGFLVCAEFEGRPVEIWLTQNPLYNKVSRNFADIQRYLDHDVPMVTVEGLLLLKLFALPAMFRQESFAAVSFQEAEIATLLHDFGPNVTPLLDELSVYLSDGDITEIISIILDIQKRINRYKKGTFRTVIR